MAWHLLFGKNKFPETFASSKVSVFISDKGFVDRTLIRAAGIMLFYLELNGSVSGWVQNTKAVPKQIVKRKGLLPGPAECSVVTCLLVLQIVIHDELPSGHLSVFTWGSDKQWAIGHVLSCPLDHRYNTRFLVFAGNYETESIFFFYLNTAVLFTVLHVLQTITYLIDGFGILKLEAQVLCHWAIQNKSRVTSHLYVIDYRVFFIFPATQRTWWFLLSHFRIGVLIVKVLNTALLFLRQ